jgi:hypothetical protein
MGWEAFLVSGTAAQLLSMEESDNKHLIAEREQVRKMMRDLASKQDAANPTTIADRIGRGIPRSQAWQKPRLPWP